MRPRVSLLVLVIVAGVLSQAEARTRQRGGKGVASSQPQHGHRAKRTIGDIINWKLNLIQTILGGIGGLFGGGNKTPARPSYGPPRPQRPQGGGRPSYRPQRPQGPARPRPPVRPPGPQQRPPRPQGPPQFGPGDAIKVLPAPNLATGRPPVSAGPGLGSSPLDTVTSGGGPAAQRPNTDSYGAPQGPVIQQPRAPAAASIISPPAPAPAPVAALPAIPTQYGSGATNTWSPGAPVITDNSAPFAASQPAPAPAPDSYGGAIAPVVAPQGRAPAPAPDTYGGAIAPVLAPVTVTTARSFTVDYDDYDPNDVPIDQAAPAALPGYGISTPAPLPSYDSAALPDPDDYDPNDVPADQAAPQSLDVYGSAAPVGTSAPVPDAVFTSDDGPVQTSYDTPVIDLTEAGPEVVEAPLEADIEDAEDTVIDLGDSASDSLSQGAETASLLPPVGAEEEQSFSDNSLDAATTAAPVLFTYAPSEGSTVDDISAQVNILVQNAKDGGSPTDPLNVIPDEYEYEEDFGIEEFDQVVNYVDDNELPEDPEDYAPAFDDLRGIQFTTAPSLVALDDPEPTTYRAPIDFDLGTTASTGIEVGEVLTSLDDELAEAAYEEYEDEYEREDETNYAPSSDSIPIVEAVTLGSVQEEALPGYNPVPVLLVGTPEKEESRSSVGNKVEEIPLYDEDLDTRAKSKRQFRGGNQSSSSKLRKLYNNWYNGRNDWSRKIAKVQGRIRFKKLNQNSS